jgi:hypothetical protein
MKTLELKTPVQWGEKTISVLEFQPLKAKHIRGLGASRKFGDMLDLVSKSALQPSAMIDELSAADAIAAVEIVSDFLVNSPAIGPSVSE